MKKILVLLFLVSTAHAVRIKVAALVPKGTNWAKTLKDMSTEIRKATKSEVNLKIYYGGVQGDEPDVLRKIRTGQLHGGIFTGKTLGDIDSDIRVMEIPFNFNSDRSKAYRTLNKLEPTFVEKLEAKKFVSLGFYEIGFVYLASTKKVLNLEELKGIKVWSWEGDKVVDSMINALKLVSVPVALPDVLSSLSTGIIDAAYAPPLGMLALQWQSKVKYIVDFPVAYSIGALVVTKKIWDKVSIQNREIAQKIARKYVQKANDFSVKDNEESKKILVSQGIKFIKFPPENTKKAREIRNKVVDELVAKKIISSSILKQLEDVSK